MRLRRRRCVVCYWHGRTFVAHGYPGLTPVALHPVAAEILTAFSEWTEPVEAAESLDGFDRESTAQAVVTLCENGLLVAEHSAEAEQDERVAAAWGPWAPEAPLFHYTTQDEIYIVAGPNVDRIEPTDQAVPPDDVADPPVHTLFTGYPDADRILLPRRPAPLTAPFDQVLYGRRTHRDFADEPVALATLSTLLATVFGPVDFADSGRSALLRRTSASGGSRQELDAYLGIRNVTGVEPGLYHYNSLEHSLELLSEGLSREQVVEMCGGQDWTGDTAFIVALSAEMDRMLSKYRTPRCYRVCLLDAGHLGQTFALVATALGLGPFQTAAFHDSGVAEAFGLDNIERTPLYILAAGHPNRQPTTTPPIADLNTFRRTTVAR